MDMQTQQSGPHFVMEQCGRLKVWLIIEVFTQNILHKSLSTKFFGLISYVYFTMRQKSSSVSDF